MDKSNLKRKNTEDASEQEESSSKEQKLDQEKSGSVKQKSSNVNPKHMVNRCNINTRTKKDGSYIYVKCEKQICVESVLNNHDLCQEHFEKRYKNLDSVLMLKKMNRLENYIFGQMAEQMNVKDETDLNKVLQDYLKEKHPQFNINGPEYEAVKNKFMKLIEMK